MDFINLLKEHLIHLFPIVLLFMTVACSDSDDHVLEIKVLNTLSESRPDAQIIIKRDSLDKYNSNLTDGFFEIMDNQQEPIPYQLDDLDGDGQWDELALVYLLKADSTKSLFLRTVDDDPIPSFNDRAQVWFAKLDSISGDYNELKSEVRPIGYERNFTTPFYYQFEGPGWENDKIGFRIYFDERNAIDIWGKQTSDLVLQNVGIGDDNYHSMADWGMDILHVGNSLGGGAIGAKMDDELYRLENTNQEMFEEVVDGPVRAIFDLSYSDWPVGDKEYTIKERITIWAGDQGYYNEVSLTNPQDSLNLIAGIVTAKLNGEPTFGDFDHPFQYLMSHGLQSYNGANLGMSIISTTDNFMEYGSEKFTGGAVDSTAFIEFNLTQNNPVTYKFIAIWETRDSEFGESQAFENYVLSAGRRMQKPVLIQFD